MVVWKEINSKQQIEVGILMALASIVIYYFHPFGVILLAAFVILMITLIVPVCLKPISWLWFNIASLVSLIVPMVLFTILYYTLVTSVGLTRKLMGKDSLQLRTFKKDKESVFCKMQKTIDRKSFERQF